MGISQNFFGDIMFNLEDVTLKPNDGVNLSTRLVCDPDDSLSCGPDDSCSPDYSYCNPD